MVNRKKKKKMLGGAFAEVNEIRMPALTPAPAQPSQPSAPPAQPAKVPQIKPLPPKGGNRISEEKLKLFFNLKLN